MPASFTSLLLVAVLALPGLARAQVGPVMVRIDADHPAQTIANFAASDAWSCQFVGQWPTAKKEAIADLLFSQEASPDGQPKGIGLSMWRFNVGAGSAEQGAASDIKDEWRRAESFLKPDGTYDFTRQAGQRWFLEAARRRGVRQFLAFLNSPPVGLTRNGKAHADHDQTNLDSTRYAALGAYCARVVAGVRQATGITFDYFSPINEPQWDWSGGQEGSPYRNREAAGVVKALSAALVDNKLPTKLLIPEAGKLNHLYEWADKPGRGDQIAAFFGAPAAPTSVAKVPQVAPIIAGHSYFTTSPAASAVAVRQRLAARVAAVPGLRYWQSEYCILGDNAGEINGGPRDLGMAPALYLARTIHLDLAVGNAAAWQWWLAISPYDYKDGLVYVDKNKTDGNYYPSKMLWALGNYSRFVRPGAVRLPVALADSTRAGQPLVSAYRSPTGKQLVVVLVNDHDAPATVQLELAGRQRLRTGRTYVTSATADLQPGLALAAGRPLVVGPRSVVTLVSELR
ncbi:glycoside hydrolase [Hymenobacter rubidus]|uniref:glycoside hydrolase n=1 Tax=Hymenobacter rubidus TaxID=1441626 RepID=UPI00191FC9F4|nr:glycoside hydrolase [Hymenobacter rubidus]